MIRHRVLDEEDVYVAVKVSVRHNDETRELTISEVKTVKGNAVIPWEALGKDEQEYIRSLAYRKMSDPFWQAEYDRGVRRDDEEHRLRAAADVEADR